MSGIAAIATSYLNRTENYRIHDDIQPIGETYFDEDVTPGEIFRESQKEYGRCESKVYVSISDPDNPGNEVAMPIGWVFTKLQEYDDTKEKYLQEVWVTLLREYDPRPRMSHYYIGGAS